MELSLSQSKFDTLKTKQDSVIRAKLEAEVGFRLIFVGWFLCCPL